MKRCLSTGHIGLDGSESTESTDPVLNVVTKKSCRNEETPFSSTQPTSATASYQGCHRI